MIWPLTQFEERLLWLALVAALVIGFGWYEQGRGAAKCVAADTKAASTQIAHNATVEAQAATIVSQEKTTYEQAVAAPVLVPIHVSVCHEAARGAMSNAAATGSSADARAPVRTTDRPDPVPGPDIGPSLQAVGKDATAQVAGLIDYVNKVCLAR